MTMDYAVSSIQTSQTSETFSKIAPTRCFRKDVGCFGECPKTPTRPSPRRFLITPTRIGGAPGRFSNSSEFAKFCLRVAFINEPPAAKVRSAMVVVGFRAGDFIVRVMKLKSPSAKRILCQVPAWLGREAPPEAERSLMPDPKNIVVPPLPERKVALWRQEKIDDTNWELK